MSCNDNPLGMGDLVLTSTQGMRKCPVSEFI